MPVLTRTYEEIQIAEERREKLLKRAYRACEYLYSIGAKEVYIFGSIISKEDFRIYSDVDIAVRGLPHKHIYNIEHKIGDILETEKFDLIYFEYVPDFMIKSIKERGIKYNATNISRNKDGNERHKERNSGIVTKNGTHATHQERRNL